MNVGNKHGPSVISGSKILQIPPWLTSDWDSWKTSCPSFPSTWNPPKTSIHWLPEIKGYITHAAFYACISNFWRCFFQGIGYFGRSNSLCFRIFSPPDPWRSFSNQASPGRPFVAPTPSRQHLWYPVVWRRLCCDGGGMAFSRCFFVYNLLISNMSSIRNRSVFHNSQWNLFAIPGWLLILNLNRLFPMSAAILRSGGKSHHVTPSSWFFWVGHNLFAEDVWMGLHSR